MSQNSILLGHLTLYTQSTQQQQLLKFIFFLKKLKRLQLNTNCATSSFLTTLNWKQTHWSSSSNTLILTPILASCFWLGLGFEDLRQVKMSLSRQTKLGWSEKKQADEQTLTALLLYSADHTVHMKSVCVCLLMCVGFVYDRHDSHNNPHQFLICADSQNSAPCWGSKECWDTPLLISFSSFFPSGFQTAQFSL